MLHAHHYHIAKHCQAKCKMAQVLFASLGHEKRGHSVFSTRPESKAAAFVLALIYQDDFLAPHMGVSMVNENVLFFCIPVSTPYIPKGLEGSYADD